MSSAQGDLARCIDALLPQTQCTRCGYPACLAYAHAIEDGEADINQCPPGGASGIEALARLLGRAAKPLNPANGVEKPADLALIDEEVCIGCTKCIQACPVDAIVGASKVMHTVLTDECTGCELCIPPCPVDCITMVPAADGRSALQRAPQFRARYLERNARLARNAGERSAQLESAKSMLAAGAGSSSTVQAAILRARAKRSAAASKAKP
jgi:electron transport complex protein RnfB